MARLTASAVRHVVLGSTLAAVLGIAGCGGHKPTEPSPVCTVTIDPTGREFPEGGGAGTAAVSTSAARCTWAATVDAGWVTIVDGANGEGAGTVTYSVGANSGSAPRTAIVTIEGAQHAIRQSGQSPAPVCDYRIEPREASFNSPGGDGSVTVTVEAGCAWTAVSNASWVELTSSGQGTGTGTVTYAVDRNQESTSRTATLTIADQSVTITQSGAALFCEYRVTPVQFSPCMPAGTLQTEISTGASCRWTVSASVPWLTIASDTSGRGPTAIRFTFPANYDAPRDGLVMVRWPTATAGQNVRVSQAGCIYGVTKTAIDFTAAGGSGTFEVTQQSDPMICGGPKQDACIWTATADVAWITITSSMPHTGDGPVAFGVAANGGTAVRTGTIRVRDKVVRVTQAGS